MTQKNRDFKKKLNKKIDNDFHFEFNDTPMTKRDKIIGCGGMIFSIAIIVIVIWIAKKL